MKKKIALLLIIVLIFSFSISSAEPIAIPKVGLTMETAETPQDTVASLQIIFFITILSLAPAILIMMTSFTRIIIILSFLRNALGTNQMPPNQILIGLALFLTLFIMSPTLTTINNEALTPFVNGQINQQQALDIAQKPIKEFMLKQINGEKDLALFVELSGQPAPASPQELPMSIVIPAFILNELKIAFQIGFILYIPFLIIDMVVSSTLMSMGMMMLPPVTISLPFKILMFVMVDGWNLIAQTIVMGFK